MADQPVDLSGWIGREEDAIDVVAAGPLRGLRAILDIDEAGAADDMVLPPAGHWLFFLPMARQSRLGPDGHPRRGGFLPPIALPRRMWAGSVLHYHRPVHIGAALARKSRIADISEKHGRSGTLVFVAVDHEISVDGQLAITERQDIVYREMPQAGEMPPPAVPAPAREDWCRRIDPDPVLLFRYSALTHNGHRIHYDRSYATGVERYPGLVVHGPLIATLLLDLLRREAPGSRVQSYTFRAVKPLIDTQSFELCGAWRDVRTVDLWARNEEGALAMQAIATVSN